MTRLLRRPNDKSACGRVHKAPAGGTRCNEGGIVRARPFQQVDVFTGRAYFGNPLAVVLDGGDLSVEEMQHFTDWTNLSEATFVLPPSSADADYRVRIFCPGRELSFAGHPTLGTCHAWLRAGGRPNRETIIQECGVGLIGLRRTGDKLWFSAPPLRRSGPLSEEDVERIVQGLGLARADIAAHAWCENGPAWRAVLLKSADKLRALRPDPQPLGDWDVGVVAPRGAADPVAFEVRAFFRGLQGLAEDPVTGSLNAALALWMIPSGIAPKRYVVSQGAHMGRDGYVHIECANDGVWVGGESVTCIEGSVML